MSSRLIGDLKKLRGVAGEDTRVDEEAEPEARALPLRELRREEVRLVAHAQLLAAALEEDGQARQVLLHCDPPHLPTQAASESCATGGVLSQTDPRNAAGGAKRTRLRQRSVLL